MVVRNREVARGIAIISGAQLEGTPVVRAFRDYWQTRSVEVTVVEYAAKRGEFLGNAVKTIRHCGKDVILIFVNPQSLPVLLLAQLFKRKNPKFYWALESYQPVETKGPLRMTVLLEKLISERNTGLIVPIEERRPFYADRFARSLVIENVPRKGLNFIKRSLGAGERIALVHYGSLRASDTYVEEFCELVSAHPRLFTLDLIGEIPRSVLSKERENIQCIARLKHDELIARLRRKYHYSLVGYRPTNYNNTYCAPNKLFESMSLSLPVLGNSRNPPLVRVLSETGGGELVDFERLDAETLLAQLAHNYAKKNVCAFRAYSQQYNFESVIERSLGLFCEIGS